jgi:hypothetical protein
MWRFPRICIQIHHEENHMCRREAGRCWKTVERKELAGFHGRKAAEGRLGTRWGRLSSETPRDKFDG